MRSLPRKQADNILFFGGFMLSIKTETSEFYLENISI